MEKLYVCKFNRMVDCGYNGGQCGRCGWNPVVHDKRMLERMKKQKNKEETKSA